MMIVFMMILCVILGVLYSMLFLTSRDDKKRKDFYSEIREKVIFDSVLDTDTLLERSNKRIESQFRDQQVNEPADTTKESKDQKG